MSQRIRQWKITRFIRPLLAGTVVLNSDAKTSEPEISTLQIDTTFEVKPFKSLYHPPLYFWRRIGSMIIDYFFWTLIWVIGYKTFRYCVRTLIGSEWDEQIRAK
jgi:hypothetical protein